MSSIAESLREEVADLQGCIAGLPDDLRAGPFGAVYQGRLDALLDELAREELLLAAKEAMRPAMDLRVSTRGGTYQVAAQFMGELLQGWQGLVWALGQAAAGRPTSRGVIPGDIINQTTLDVVAFAPGSFVSRLVLEQPDQATIPGARDLGVLAFDEFERLWDAGPDHHELTVLMGNLKGRVLSSYGRLLQVLARSNAELKVAFAEPSSDEVRQVHLNVEQVVSVLDVLEKVKGPEEETVQTFVGRLNAAHLRTGSFEIDLGEEGTLTGKIGGSEAVAGLVIGNMYNFEVTEIISKNPFTGDYESSFLLNQATPRGASG